MTDSMFWHELKNGSVSHLSRILLEVLLHKGKQVSVFEMKYKVLFMTHFLPQKLSQTTL